MGLDYVSPLEDRKTKFLEVRSDEGWANVLVDRDSVTHCESKVYGFTLDNTESEHCFVVVYRWRTDGTLSSGSNSEP